MKAGTYYVGDPCYIFDKSWDEIITNNDYFSERKEYNLYGYQCWVGQTAYGDGCYADNEGNEYAVDAGIIGVLPVELINLDKCTSLEDINNSPYMHIIEFTEDFCVDYDNGTFYIGDFRIYTDEKEDDSYDEEY